jgi:hypothetical protein
MTIGMKSLQMAKSDWLALPSSGRDFSYDVCENPLKVVGSHAAEHVEDDPHYRSRLMHTRFTAILQPARKIE